MSDLSDPPAEDEIEISLFGPGVGEACVIHLTGGKWLVIDSCINRKTRENAVTSYFDRMGIDMGEAVALIVATHAHNDHIGNMSRIVERSKSARYVCSVAMSLEEFFELSEVDLELEEVRESVMDELRRIEVELAGRQPEYAQAGLELYVRRESELPSVRIQALSPSDEEIRSAQRRLANAFPKPGDSPKPLPQDPNEMAVVLWVEVGGDRILLGSDLLSGPAPWLWLGRGG
jgi:hypothetical protein